MSINVTVWSEELRNEDKYREIYPNGINGAVRDSLIEDDMSRFNVRTAGLNEPDQGLPDDVLYSTDVLFWWGHINHNNVDDALVEKIVQRVRDGMGLVVLHSGHYSKVFKRLVGTGCRLKWREAEALERIWVIEQGHPIAAGLPEFFEFPHEETYGEKFDIPAPDELVFISWFSDGMVCRSGCCFNRGRGKIFYFRPGDEGYGSYYIPEARQVLRNAAAWAAPVNGPAPTYGQYNLPNSLENVQ